MGYSYQKGFGWPHVLFTLLLLVILALMFTPVILRESYRGDTETINNAKAIASALVSFKEDFGSFPCPETREVLHKQDPTVIYKHDEFRIRSEDDANAYLAQLLVSDHLDTESFFYSSGVKGAIKGDNIMGTADRLLAKGENSFAYLMTSDKKPLTDTSSGTPIVIASIIRLENKVPIFDPRPYGDRYIYGRADGSGARGKISREGLPLSKGRKYLFEAGPDSLFGNQVPVIKYPLGF